MSISIFARPYFLGQELSTGEPYLHRVTSLVRGEQIAEYIGGKYNPTSGYENDVCIYHKPKRLDHIKDTSYVDVSDADCLVEQLQHRPQIKVIASSQCSYEFLKEKLKNEIVLIPEHHCNFERVVRERKTITTGGIIGHPSVFSGPVNDEIRKQLEEIGLKFITCFNYKNRQDSINFYKQIDFQVIGHFGYLNNYDPFNHPSKMINAASFGIPTIANWKLGYKEFEGSYIPVRTMDSLVAEAEKMKNENYYNEWADKIIKEAEKYHISKVAEMYKQLEMTV